MALTLTPDNEEFFEMNDTEVFKINADENSYSQTRRKHIPCRRELLVSSLHKFYNGIENLDELVEIMQGNGPYSLRLIDVFVTNYSKKHNTSYMLNGQEFLVYLNYKSQTKAYSKKLFDPFCRHDRIIFQCGKHEAFMTTVGQLNFFRWAHEKGVLNYIQNHVEDIRKEEKESRKQNSGSQNSTDTVSSNISLSSSNANTSTTQRKRRTEKIPASIKLLHKHDVEIVMSFD